MDTALFEERVKEIPRLRSCLSGGRVERWPRKQALRDMLFDIVIDCMHEGPTWTEREITQVDSNKNLACGVGCRISCFQFWWSSFGVR